MAKNLVALLALAALALSLGACEKKEETPITGAPPGTQPQGVQPALTMPAGQPEIVVPESVKGRWAAVVITVEDKVNKTSEDVTVKLNGSHTLPDSNLRIEVGQFLPDFKMEGMTITSSSNEPNNPAVRVTVYEGDQEIFRGWLYSKFPAIHPFQHERFGLLLKKGVTS
ncbi:MAG: DUF2155 domain-containing protein [Nitrospirota bacterium]|jgi:hypothetical protein